MKRKLFISLLTLLIGNWTVAQNSIVKVTSIDQGDYFTCLNIDEEQTLWVGTKKQGIMFSDKTNGVHSLFPFPTSENFEKLTLTSIDTKTQGGATTIWVASHKASFSDKLSGGIDVVSKNTNGKPFSFNLNRNKVYAAGLGLPVKEVGLPNNQCTAVHVDHSGNVWSTHGWEDLTITGSQSFLINPFTGLLEIFGQSAGYYVRPGALARKGKGSLAFNDVTMDQMPYPAWTIKTPITRSAQTRRFVSLTSTKDEIFAGFYGYTGEDEVTQVNTGIAKYSLNGQLMGYINHSTAPELPFTESFASPSPVALHATESGDLIVGFNRNLGFAIQKGGQWTYIENLLHYDTTTQQNVPSTFFPDNLGFPFVLTYNNNGAIDCKGERIFIGTSNGLLVYKGKGDYLQDSSYIHVTTEDGLSSNKVLAVKAGIGGFVYVVTDAGVDEVFIPSDVSIFHIATKEQPYLSTLNGDVNYEPMITLGNLHNNQTFVTPKDVPKFASDGTTSSVFRYFTDDFEGFYAENSKYGLEIDDETATWDWNLIDTLRYGKFSLRPRENYEDPMPNYVDIIYTHPYELPSEVTDLDLISRFAITYNDGANDIVLFEHPIQFVLPPVLLVHGVWSSIESLKDLEEHLLQKVNYKPYQVHKIFKQNAGPERPMHGDAKEVPHGIDVLLRTSKAYALSAGKVTIICHSRGGLNTRAYIEELDAPGKTPQVYRHDIHSLITLNTPHSGSQLANMVVDNRKFKFYLPLTDLTFFLGGKALKGSGTDISNEIPINNELLLSNIKNQAKPFLRYGVDALTIGDIFSLAAGADRKDRNGAYQLEVDRGYVTQLNDPAFLNKLAEYKVPIHAVATNFRPCLLLGGDCSDDLEAVQRFEDQLKTVTGKIPQTKWISKLIAFKKYYNIVAYTDKDITKPKTIDGLLRNIFNGEDNDMIVPESSMEGGLDDKYISSFEGYNINHISGGPVFDAVTEADVVANKLTELLKQDPNGFNSGFTTEGLSPAQLEYNFKPETLEEFFYNLLPQVQNDDNDNNLPYDATFNLIPEDSLNTKYQTGDTVHFSLLSENVDKALILFEKESSDFIYTIDGPVVELTGDNLLSFIIPSHFAGFSNIKALGYKDDHLFIMDYMSLYTGLNDSLVITDFKIKSNNSSIEIPLQTTHSTKIIATVIDSLPIDVELNGVDGVITYITDTSIAKLTSSNTILGKAEGSTYLISSYDNKYIDTVLVTVVKNPNLEFTIINGFDFYSPSNEDAIAIEWTTSQEYNCKEMILERKIDEDNGQGFVTINTQAGNQAKYEVSSYDFLDRIELNNKTTYRIKVVNEDDSFFYSNSLDIFPKELATFVFDNVKEDSENQFKLLINPTQQSNLIVSFNASNSSGNGVLSLFDLNGVQISNQIIDLKLGENRINVELPNFISPGLYIVNLKDGNHIYSKRVMITD